MTPQNQMLANAFKAKYQAVPIAHKNIQSFLKSIPNAVNLKEDPEISGVYSIQVMTSPTNILLVESNGIDFLITSLT